MPSRRDFIARAASTSLLAAILVDLAHAAPHAADDTDLSWVSRLRGKSRAVFDSPGVSEGGALFRAALWRSQINKDKLSHADAEKRAKENLLPGVIIQPSGFFAVLKAQDEGCKYMMGS